MPGTSGFFHRLLLPVLAVTACAAAGAAAQGLPAVGPVVGDIQETVTGATGDLLDDPLRAAAPLARAAARLAEIRLDRLTALVRANRAALEMDETGAPSVRGQVIGVDPSPEALAAAVREGFTLISDDRIEGVGIRSVVLAVPEGMALKSALVRLRRVAPGDWSANQLHFTSGAAGDGTTGALAKSAAATSDNDPTLGMIDGGVAAHPVFSGPIEQRGFAGGAPATSPHGTAVASLLVGKGAVQGVLPGAPLIVADVYGTDPAGGNAVAIARALGWMVAQRVPVVTISLVGPSNPLLARVIASARSRGTQIVAAVGNDGPASPPSYPASYPGVIAVTAVDKRDRALIEAGRSLHLDYAAPGADIRAAAPRGRTVDVRGTSFAAPLVAGRLAARYPRPDPGRIAASITLLDKEAIDLGKRGPDKIYGRGLVCRACRTPR